MKMDSSIINNKIDISMHREREREQNLMIVVKSKIWIIEIRHLDISVRMASSN